MSSFVILIKPNIVYKDTTGMTNNTITITVLTQIIKSTCLHILGILMTLNVPNKRTKMCHINFSVFVSNVVAQKLHMSSYSCHIVAFLTLGYTITLC